MQRLSPRRRQSYAAVKSRSGSRPTSPTDVSVVMRPRKVDLPAPTVEDAPQQSPRLMLPPPEQSLTLRARLTKAVQQSPIIEITKILVLYGKMVSLTMPCTPYAPKVWLLYPLLGLAITDLILFGRDVRASVLLLSVHVAVVVVARQHERLCEGRDWGRLGYE